jgi:hypothetical protein
VAGILKSRSTGRLPDTASEPADEGPDENERVTLLVAPYVAPSGEVVASGHVRVLPDDGPPGALAVSWVGPDQVQGRSARHGDTRSTVGGPSVDLRGLGLPEHLLPPDGGVFPLLALLEAMPQARLPSLRAGDDVVVVTVDPHFVGRCDPDAALSPEAVAAEVAQALGDSGLNIDPAHVCVMAWPCDDDHRRTTRAELVEEVRARRARLEFLFTEPDCPPTTAYAACRSLPSTQLYLTGVLRSRRPAAPLGWGAPVAFVDGRRAWPAVLAAVFADRLAGGVA